MKKFTAFVMAALLAAFMAAPAFAYTDVSNNQAITTVSEKGIMEGYEDGSFKPDAAITRAEFAKVAALATIEKKGDVPMTEMYFVFDDVKEDGWYVDHIQRAANMGLMKGDAEGTFRPNDTVSVAEVYTVMLRMLGYNADNTGTWPTNYITTAQTLGADVNLRDANKPCDRALAAEVVAWALSTPLADDDSNTEVALDTYALVTAVGTDRVTVYTTAGETKTLRDTGSNGAKLEAGQLVRVQANSNGVLQAVSVANVRTNNLYEASISRDKIELNGKDYAFAKDAVVLTINSGGGVGTVAVDKVLESSYVAGLRSSKYTVPIQYVLEGSSVGCLLISDYAGLSDLRFGFVEDVALNADGTVVKFWGDDNDYQWDASKNDGKDPEIDKLYAYNFRGDGVRGYAVDTTAEDVTGEVKNGSQGLYRTENGNFIVADDTVIIKVERSTDGSISDCYMYDDIDEGDMVRVRYKVDKDAGIEAAYVIIEE